MGSAETLDFHIDSLDSRYSSSIAVDNSVHVRCKQNLGRSVYSPNIQGILGPNTEEDGQMPVMTRTDESLKQRL